MFRSAAEFLAVVPVLVRRTFAAAKHPEGSAERANLNLSWRTSEYYPSQPYAVTWGMIGRSEDYHTFRTKREALAVIQSYTDYQAQALPSTVETRPND